MRTVKTQELMSPQTQELKSLESQETRNSKTQKPENLETHRLYLSLGTNLGDRKQNLLRAVKEIEKRIGKIVSLSAFYTTEAWGFTSENLFLNAALRVDTTLTPLEILRRTQTIEYDMGRIHKSVNGQYADRVIDIDLLLYDTLVQSVPELTLPHPLMQERHFVMEPLAEIAPEVVHPVFGRTMKELLDALSPHTSDQ